mmetsp:Transcript_34964/g.69015  ORF Transcript_34964/g.69015 Transcript_34964/m.69015 type:complete len:98 (-) Transcript_34964:36-329(-)
MERKFLFPETAEGTKDFLETLFGTWAENPGTETEEVLDKKRKGRERANTPAEAAVTERKRESIHSTRRPVQASIACQKSKASQQLPKSSSTFYLYQR